MFIFFLKSYRCKILDFCGVEVNVQFVIGCDGYVTNITIVKGVDNYLDAEALRVISTLPKWEHGKQRGKNVPVSFIIPINFILN